MGRSASRSLTGLPLALVAGLHSAPAAAQAAPDTLPRQLNIRQNVVALTLGELCRIRIGSGFTYVGGQRFILLSVADAEQHFFVKADSTGRIREFFWLQRETLLPGRGGGYTYGEDSTLTVGGLPWKVNLRINRGSPPPGSDGAATVALLSRMGYSMPAAAPRLRLVYLPVPGGTQEFMIIYWSALQSALPDTSLEGTLRRATRGLAFERCQ